jgi:invasion protein IalB
MRVPYFRFAIAAVVLIGAVPPSIAQDGEPVARYEYWDVHVVDGPDGKTCFIASQPIDSQPTDVVRSPILFTISNGAGYTPNQVHVEMGYPLDSPVSIKVDDELTFTMTFGWDGTEGAWFQTDVENDLLVEAMQRGRSMVVTARSTRGTDTTDTYSLYGVTDALARSAEECS